MSYDPKSRMARAMGKLMSRPINKVARDAAFSTEKEILMNPLVIKILNAAREKPRTKSEIIKRVMGRSWPGYASRDYVQYSQGISNAWKECVAKEFIIWNKGQKVTLTATGMNLLGAVEQFKFGRVG